MEAPACPGCRLRDAGIAALERRVAELEALLRELLDRLNQNASNSSVPPLANPPQDPKPVVKRPTGRRAGDQPGQPPHLKQLLRSQRVTTVTDYVPGRCEQCRAPLSPQTGPADPPPARFQVIDLPEVTAVVHEHGGHAPTCPGCGHASRAAVPAAVRAHSVGPGLTATLAYLTGGHGLSKRAAEEVSAAVFAAPVSLGTVSRLEVEASAALESAHQETLAAVRRAPVKHADETGWKVAGKLRWLWAAATQTVAVFLVHAGRGTAALTTLLGAGIEGLLHSDRWHASNLLPERRRQLCWAHLKRDFQKWRERTGAGAEIGREGLTARPLRQRGGRFDWHDTFDRLEAENPMAYQPPDLEAVMTAYEAATALTPPTPTGRISPKGGGRPHGLKCFGKR